MTLLALPTAYYNCCIQRQGCTQRQRCTQRQLLIKQEVPA